MITTLQNQNNVTFVDYKKQQKYLSHMEDHGPECATSRRQTVQLELGYVVVANE
jgi:hypothetical protein